MSKVGEKIKELRMESGITQLQLGDYAGCSGQVISNIERGYTNPSAAVLKKISEYFHVPSDYLLGKSKSQWLALDPETTIPYIGARISDLLNQASVRIESFAEAVDITPEEAADILDGSVTPNIGTLARISRFLNTSIDFLIGSVPYPTIISSEDEEDIVLYYRTMSKTGRRLLMGALEDFKDR